MTLCKRTLYSWGSPPQRKERIMENTLEQARARYAAAIKGGDEAEFIAAKSALIATTTGTVLTDEQAAYI